MSFCDASTGSLSGYSLSIGTSIYPIGLLFPKIWGIDRYQVVFVLAYNLKKQFSFKFSELFFLASSFNRFTQKKYGSTLPHRAWRVCTVKFLIIGIRIEVQVFDQKTIYILFSSKFVKHAVPFAIYDLFIQNILVVICFCLFVCLFGGDDTKRLGFVMSESNKKYNRVMRAFSFFFVFQYTNLMIFFLQQQFL